jgi:hypothetical protein
LHAELEWDDTIAGHNWRLFQVRRLILIHVRTEEGVKQIVSRTIDRTKGGGYRHLDAVMAAPDLRSVLLKDALDEYDLLSCVAGLSGVLTGHLWNRYADENSLLRISKIYILTARAGSVDVAQRYRAATTSQERPIRATSANEE